MDCGLCRWPFDVARLKFCLALYYYVNVRMGNGSQQHITHNNTLAKCIIISQGSFRRCIYNVYMVKQGEFCENKILASIEIFVFALKPRLCSGWFCLWTSYIEPCVVIHSGGCAVVMHFKPSTCCFDTLPSSFKKYIFSCLAMSLLQM